MDLSRRDAFRKIGFTLAGVGAVGTSGIDAALGSEKLERLGAEIEHLQRRYDELDARTKLLIKVALTYTGIDILSDVASIVWLSDS